MAVLQEHVKQFIVESLACFDTFTEVVRAVKEEFDIDLPRQQVSLYDPTKHSGRHLSDKWRVIFDKTRASFKAETLTIPIAQRAYRLRKLSSLADKAEKMRNYPLVMQLLEQAAKEVGESYVNHRKSNNDPDDQTVNPVKIEISVNDARIRDDDQS